MHKPKLSTWVGTSLLASSMLLLPVATAVAQTATPPPETRPPEYGLSKHVTITAKPGYGVCSV